MTYRTEFRDFPPEDMPPIPEGWTDVSWHNETCPCFAVGPEGEDGAGIYVFVDYADPALREFPDVLFRFGAYVRDAHGRNEREHESNDWDSIVATVAAWQRGEF